MMNMTRMLNCDWKIHKKLLDGGGLGPKVYICSARANGKLATQREIESRLRAEGRTVVYVRPDKKPVRGTTLAGVLIDEDVLTPERWERAEGILNKFNLA